MAKAAAAAGNLVREARAPPGEPEVAAQERLKLWYATADTGYHTRNQMAPEQFTKMIFLYQAFLTMLVAFALWVEAKAGAGGGLAGIAPWIALLLEASGLLCMLAMHVDLCSTLSAKYAMQAYLEAWDAGTVPAKGPRQVVIERPTYPEEALKHVLAGEGGKVSACLSGPRARRAQFVVVSRLLIGLWLLTSVAVSGWLAGLA